MNKEALVRMVRVVLSQSIEVESGRSVNGTTKSAKLTMSDSEKIQLLQLIMREDGCTQEKAVELIGFCLQSEKTKSKTGCLTWIVGSVVLLWLIGIACIAGMGLFTLLMALLFLAAVVLFICYISFSRLRVMRKLWREKDRSPQGTKYAMEEMLKVSQGSNWSVSNKLIAVCLVAVAVLSGTLMINPNAFSPTYVRLYALIDSAETNAQLTEAMNLLMGLNDYNKVEDTLLKTNDAMLADGKQTLLLAEVAWRMKVWTSEEAYTKILQDALNNMDLSEIDKAYELERMQARLMDGDLQTVRALTDRVVALDGDNQRFLSMLGSYYGEKTTTVELMQMSEKFGHAKEFLTSALADDYVEQIIARMDKVESQEQRKLILQCSANNFTAPNDVLKIISKAREHGLTAVECYPDGAVIDFDASQLALVVWTEDWPGMDYLLPLICLERAEPLEYKTVPDDKLDMDDKLVELYAEEYEGNIALGKEAFTVRLDTAVMDRMPVEMIPQTIEETQLLMVTGTYYVRSGTILHRNYIMEDNENGIEEEETLWKRHYPVYSAVQTVDLFEYKTGKVFYRFRVRIADSKALLLVDEENGTDGAELKTEELEKEYIGLADPAWMETAKEEVLQLFEENEWYLDVAALLDMMSQELVE